MCKGWILSILSSSKKHQFTSSFLTGCVSTLPTTLFSSVRSLQLVHFLGFWHPSALGFGTWYSRRSLNNAELIRLPPRLYISFTSTNRIFLFTVFPWNYHHFLYKCYAAISPHAMLIPKHSTLHLYLSMNFYSFHTTPPVCQDHFRSWAFFLLHICGTLSTSCPLRIWKGHSQFFVQVTSKNAE